MTDTSDPAFLVPVADYYSEKISDFGPTPKGVDWNGQEGQSLRFEQLGRIIDRKGGFSVNDLGCGYGALLEYLDTRIENFTYYGFDISKTMITAAKARFEGHNNATFQLSNAPREAADYSFASGIFNVKLGKQDDEWKAYILEALDILNRNSKVGFSFNCLTSYSDVEHMRPDLYYADPCEIFDICKRKYAKDVALLHDYGLYEFTILVRKS